MLKAKPVPIPKGRNLFFKNKANGAVYIEAEISRTWDAKNKYTRPKSVLIGKKCLDKEGWMIPNANFYDVFPEEPLVPLKEKQEKSGESLHAESAIEEAQKSDTNDLCKDTSLHVGGFIALSRIASDYEIPKLLEKHFGDKGRKILDLALYMILTESNALSRYEYYAASHPIFSKNQRIYSNSAISRTLSAITPSSINEFLDDWNKTTDKKEDLIVYYDSTNKNSQAKNIGLVEFGKPKVDIGSKQFNLSTAYDYINKKPLLYELYSGSTNDVKQLSPFINKLTEYGYKNLTLTLDRGYFSEQNLTEMEQKGFDYIVMVKGQHKTIDSLIEKYHGSLEDEYASSFIAKDQCLFAVKEEVTSKSGAKRYYHLYFDTARHSIKVSEFYKHLHEEEQQLHKSLGRPIEPTVDQECYFDLKLDKRNQLLSFSRKEAEIRQEAKRFGFFSIISSQDEPSSEIYNKYMTRDCNEKLFLVNKTFLGAKSARVHNEEALCGKTFIEFIASILRNYLFHMVKDLRQSSKSKQILSSVPLALMEMDRVQMLQISPQGRYFQGYALTKLQRELFSSIGLDEGGLKQELKKIADVLQSADKTFVFE